MRIRFLQTARVGHDVLGQQIETFQAGVETDVLAPDLASMLVRGGVAEEVPEAPPAPVLTPDSPADTALPSPVAPTKTKPARPKHTKATDAGHS